MDSEELGLRYQGLPEVCVDKLSGQTSWYWGCDLELGFRRILGTWLPEFGTYLFGAGTVM